MTKRINIQLTLVILIIFICPQNALTQDIKGATVKYEQMNFFDFQFTPTENVRRNAYMATLPKGKKVGKILVFNERYSLYEKDVNSSIPPPDGRGGAMLDRLAMASAPSAVLLTSWMDTKKGTRADVFELMTRLFRVEEKLEKTSWKPGKEQRKILGYICQDASYMNGNKNITAWFTSAIPFSYGPGKYYGLPGLILAVEVDGKNQMLALEINLELPDSNKIVKPSEGKKTSQEKFDAILGQKIMEWEEEQAKRKAAGGDRRN